MKNLPILFVAVCFILICGQILFAQTSMISKEEKEFADDIAKNYWNVEKTSFGGIINGRARNLVKPVCPKDFVESKTSTGIKVFVLVDENGKVEQAEAFSGDYRLFDSAENAAKESTFSPLTNSPVTKKTGLIVYNFFCKSETKKTPKVIFGGYLNAKAKNLVQPTIPTSGTWRVKPQEKVRVRVLVEATTGNILQAKAVFGHPLFRASAEQAARFSTFSPANITGEQVLVWGILTYDFPPKCEKEDSKIPRNRILNDKAKVLPKPEFPFVKTTVRGSVTVQMSVDENGDVISASAVSGHPLIRASAEKAAREAKFKPFIKDCKAVKMTGILVFNYDSPKN